MKPADPMLSTPRESVQICTDPDRYSRICRKLSLRKRPINCYNVFQASVPEILQQQGTLVKTA